MQKTIRFPKLDRLARGRNGFFVTSGVVLTTEFGDVVTIQAITGKGGVSEAARIVIPTSHLREVRDALSQMILVERQADAGCQPTGCPCSDDSGNAQPCACAKETGWTTTIQITARLITGTREMISAKTAEHSLVKGEVKRGQTQTDDLG